MANLFHLPVLGQQDNVGNIRATVEPWCDVLYFALLVLSVADILVAIVYIIDSDLY